MKVGEIAERLAKLENVRNLHPSVVSATVLQDNKSRKAQGRTLLFKTYGEGSEQHGYVSLRQVAAPPKSGTYSHDKIPGIIESTNEAVRQKLREAIAKLTWQEFETNFLTRVLEALGFNSVELTQPTRDGGKDAICQYQRGIVSSQAIVSAKHWNTQRVGAAEVQRLRGLKGNADTGIIVTSSEFTPEAKREAEASQNQRAIVLVDGALIVSTCLEADIGVKKLTLPSLYEFTGFQDEDEMP